MPKHDSCHDAVAEALKREGWQVKGDVQRQRKDRLVYIDLRALREDQTTLIEVKCFANLASPDEQYTAVGQYLIYQTFLHLQAVLHPLYLAVPVTIYETRFDDVLLETIRTHHIKLLVFDETGKRSLQWKA